MNKDDLWIRARTAAKSGALLNARDLYLEAVDTGASEIRLLKEFCSILHQIRDYDSVSKIRDASQSCCCLALLNLQLDQADEAGRYFIEALRYNCNHEAARTSLVDLYLGMGLSRSVQLLPKPSFSFSTVVNFSSLDDPFLDQCIDNICEASNRTVLVAYDRLFSGKNDLPGVRRLIERNRNKNVLFKVDSLPERPSSEWFFHYNRSRLAGYEIVRDSADYTLFIDGDEIAERQLLIDWKTNFSQSGLHPTGEGLGLRFANYYYFREPIFRSVQTECSPIMINNGFLNFLLRLNREGVTSQTYDRRFYVFGPHVVAPPIFHHFSWARTKEQMLEKIDNWGHVHDKDWSSLIEKEFQHDFDGTDFIRGYKYQVVENIFGISL